MIKQAIILAAGVGQRLLPYTKDIPKCLLDVGNKTILEYQVETLFSQGIERVSVVTGYCSEKIRVVLGTSVDYIHNPDFETTSSMYSLWLARAVAEEGFVVLNADVLFHSNILKSLLESPHPDALAVDPDAILDEESMKVLLRGERVLGLSKDFRQADAENVGMIKFSPRGSKILFVKIEELLRQGLRKVMVPYAVNAIASAYPLAAVSVHELPWIEIDFPDDYERARKTVYPAILKDPSSFSPFFLKSRNFS